ncbi:MAG: FRG domain-containing protein [Clostridia bacterium]|nr:FRG domain-containing protein [Clostridia bacterium]
MKEYVVHSWEDLQKVIFDGVWDSKIRRYRNNCIYRGMGDASWDLSPSLIRACAHDLTLEKQMLRSLKKYGYADLNGATSVWQILTIGQQYGLPTRLLDWTYSPLVAAHFATEDQDQFGLDGVIYCADLDQMNELLPQVLRNRLKADRANVFSIDTLDHLAMDLEDLTYLEEGRPFTLFFEPSSLVDRIANQYALFSLCSDPRVCLDEMPGADAFLKKITLPAAVKLEIRDKLDYINISERMIYPGLDGICKWITRRYAALGPVYNPEQPGAEDKEEE